MAIVKKENWNDDSKDVSKVIYYKDGAIKVKYKNGNVFVGKDVNGDDPQGEGVLYEDKDLKVKNIYGDEFIQKYGHKCPLGVKGRNSDNKLYREKIGWEVSQPLSIGLKKTYTWIKSQVDQVELETPWIYESPDGETIYRRELGDTKREKMN